MGKNILIVDDEPDVVTFLTDLLEDAGYMVESATSARQAMQAIEQKKPDLIILDLLMPEETGTGLYRKLHDKKKYRDIPVIIVSGLPGRNLSLNKSVPVLEKPVQEQKLLDEVQKRLG